MDGNDNKPLYMKCEMSPLAGMGDGYPKKEITQRIEGSGIDKKKYQSLMSAYGDISVGMDPLEKSEMALAHLLTGTRKAGGPEPFDGIRAAYIHFTGDTEFRGIFQPGNIAPDLRYTAGFNSSSFSGALENAMNIYVSKIYKSFPYREEIFISEKKKVTNFRRNKSVQFAYFSELSSFNPETENYPELEPYTDSKSNYYLDQKGATISLTRKMMINDEIGTVRAMMDRMTRAARLAHAKYVWRFFINNSNCPDGTPWFTVDHGNLISAELDISQLESAVTTLAEMLEPGPSGEKIGLDLATFKWYLVVPISKWSIAVKKNQCDATFTSNDLTTKDPNPCYRLFGDHNERIVTCPFMTDPNEWGVIRDCDDVPILEMSYMNGNEEPEIMRQTFPNPMGDFTFIDDTLTFKIRHEYGGTLVEYRNAFKSVVP
jgi:hypothetical protein